MYHLNHFIILDKNLKALVLKQKLVAQNNVFKSIKSKNDFTNDRIISAKAA